MKIRFLIAIFLLSLVACGQPDRAAQAAVNLTGGWIAAPPPCASGFIRVGADYCATVSSPFSQVTLSGNTAGCFKTSIPNAPLMNGSRYVYQVNSTLNAQASGSIIMAQTNIFGSDSTCTYGTNYNFEQVSYATSGLTQAVQETTITATGGPHGNFYYTPDSSTGSAMLFQLLGYYQ